MTTSYTGAASYNFTADPRYDFLKEPKPWLNQPETIVGFTASLTTISGFCVLSRLYTRWVVIRALGWDDLFVGLYLITVTTSATAICLAPVYGGLGEHLLLLPVEKIRMFLILFYIANSFYVASTAFMKLSLLFQYLRIFERGTAIHRMVLLLIGVVSIWGAAFSFMAWFPCFPVHAYWDAVFPDDKGVCYGFGSAQTGAMYLIQTGTNMCFDFIVLAIPVPLYFEGGTSKKQRIGMLVLFILGCLVNVFAAWRLGLLIQGAGNVLAAIDATFYAPDTILLAAAEVSIASIAASIPIFWPVIQERLGWIFVTKEVEISRDARLSRDRFSRLPSESELQNMNSHYNDVYILEQVDPLRPNTAAGVETTVRSEGKVETRKKARLG